MCALFCDHLARRSYDLGDDPPCYPINHIVNHVQRAVRVDMLGRMDPRVYRIHKKANLYDVLEAHEGLDTGKHSV